MPILQTELDALLELRAIERLAKAYDRTPIKLPDLSAMDYLLADGDKLVAGIEIKTRKESPEQIKQYGKLILKWRKYEELKLISELMKIPTFVLFAFDNAEGELALLNIAHLTNPVPETPPVRRNYRGLACDEEPVIYFDWSLLLHVANATPAA
jgi:hypothetical protein